MNNLIKILAITSTALCSIFTPKMNAGELDMPKIQHEYVMELSPVEIRTYEPEMVKVSSVMETEVEYELPFTEEEIDLIALITMAEAEGESDYGKRLVIDTIINRVGSEYFPDTVTDVIYQPSHFESVWNGRVDVCYVNNDIRKLVIEEIKKLTDPYVLFFCAGDYSRYGKPMYQVGNHYFSTY